MRTGSGILKIPNGNNVDVVGEATPEDFHVKWGVHVGIVKKQNLVAAAVPASARKWVVTWSEWPTLLAESFKDEEDARKFWSEIRFSASALFNPEGEPVETFGLYSQYQAEFKEAFQKEQEDLCRKASSQSN
mmetsp:Transcript_10374/g.18955  ORF Transcript_10374/g.18955 Transcript_10374/m.18955 type:complete len:132 (+) Transcript_10374:3-398(+)